MWPRMIPSKTLRSVDFRASCMVSRSMFLRSCFSEKQPHAWFIARAVSTKPVPAANKILPAKETIDSSPLTRADTRIPHAPQSTLETTHGNFRSQRFENALDLLSTQIGQLRSKGASTQIRSSVWFYLFDLATRREQLEHVSSKFSQFVEGGRQFRDEHANAFVRRCVELRCPELALSVFSNRPAYRMDLTLVAARQLLHALHEEHQLSNMFILAALFPVYNIPALSSDPVCYALVVSAYLREANNSSSKPTRTTAEIFLPPFKQLLSQTSPMPVPVEANRFLETRWMRDAMLSILDSLVVGGHEVGWIRDWCYQSNYNLSSNIR